MSEVPIALGRERRPADYRMGFAVRPIRSRHATRGTSQIRECSKSRDTSKQRLRSNQSSHRFAINSIVIGPRVCGDVFDGFRYGVIECTTRTDTFRQVTRVTSSVRRL